MKSEITDSGRTRAAAVCQQAERESIRRPPGARWACSWIVYGSGTEHEGEEKVPKEEDQFQCFFPSCHYSLMDVLKAVKESRSAWFLQAGCQSGECSFKSCSKSYGFMLSCTEDTCRIYDTVRFSSGEKPSMHNNLAQLWERLYSLSPSQHLSWTKYRQPREQNRNKFKKPQKLIFVCCHPR